MNSKIPSSMVLIVTLIITMNCSCGTDLGDIVGTINPNIVTIKDCCSGLGGDYFMGEMIPDTLIYAVNRAFVRIGIDRAFNLVSSEYVESVPRGEGKPINFIHLSDTYSKLLMIRSSFRDVSLGELAEVDLTNDNLSRLKDSSFSISSAIYWHGDDNRLVYYSYGNDQGLEAGYYLFDKTMGQDSLLVAHRSPMGPSEMLNGFDLSPDNRKLLIPNVRASREQIRTPQIIEYDLQAHQADTFSVAFDLSFVRIGLWLRYSPDGNRILYCNFPLGSLTETTNDDSEVGIIDLPSRTKRVLDVNTNDRWGGRSVQIAPTWTPDGQHIIYGSAVYFSSNGAKGFYSLYALKNVSDPSNYK